MQIEDGLIDGLFTNFGTLAGDDIGGENNVIAWGHATHVGCGWIQFPGNASTGDSFENFMVCNYAIGEAERTSCDVANSPEDDKKANNNGSSSFISYYAASSQVIEDIKLCLGAIRCRRRQLDFGVGGLYGRSGGGGRDCDQK